MRLGIALKKAGRKRGESMHYIYHVWLQNKVHLVISEEQEPVELQELKEKGGSILDSNARENLLGEVIVVRR